MSINFSGFQKTLLSDCENIVRNDNIPSCPIVGVSHFEHIFRVFFFKTKIWNKQFAHVRKKLSSKFDAVKKSPGRFSSIDYFDAAKNGMQIVYKRLVNTMDLKLKLILRKASCGRECSFANKKTPIPINKASKINEVFARHSFHINNLTTSTHKSSWDCAVYDMVQNKAIKVNRERLNDRDSRNRICDSPIYTEMCREGNNKTLRLA